MPALPSDFLIRAVWALAIVGFGLAAYHLINWGILYRAQKNGAASPDQLPEAWRGLPTILYFTTPECAPCKTIQRPALKRLETDLGERVQIIEVDASQRQDLAARWGVLSVPTTFILDAQGQLKHINHGATRAEKLKQQLESIL